MSILKKITGKKFVWGWVILSLGLTGCNASQTDIERTEITTLTQWAHLYEHDNYCEEFIESNLPVQIKMEKIDINEVDTVRVMLDLRTPDLGVFREVPTYMHDNGHSRTIPVDMVKEYVPSLMEYFVQYPLLYTKALSPDDPTQFHSLIGVDETNARIALWADMYRYDWILEAGIDLGVEVVQITDNYYVAKEGLTKEKFEEIMEAFVHGDPDKNGIDDTVGACFYGGAIRTTLTSGFGFVPGINELNGEAAHSYVLPEYKEMMKWLADLYTKGLIDPDWWTQSTYGVWDKVNDEKAGFWQSSTNAMNAWANDRPPITLIRDNPEAKILLTTGLKDDDGNVTLGYSTSTIARSNYYIGADVSDDKLVTILEMYEFCNFTDASMTLWFGEEGVDWEYDDRGDFRILNTLQSGEKGVRTFAQDTQVGELWEAITLEEDFVKGAEFWLDDGIWQKDYTYQYKEDIRNETNYEQFLVEYGSGINEIVTTYFEEWVTGRQSVNLMWGSYISELESAGYKELIEELETISTLMEIQAEYQ
ncbi:MAG: hypothetical protein R3Y54_00955 [Eubacteriales bacterium]